MGLPAHPRCGAKPGITDRRQVSGNLVVVFIVLVVVILIFVIEILKVSIK